MTHGFRVNYYDKDLFTGVAANVSANFMKYETEQLLKVLGAFLEFQHYDQAAYDDIADSITYCNHYLAPIKASPVDIANAFAAYAKFEHERGDLFISLARFVHGVTVIAQGTSSHPWPWMYSEGEVCTEIRAHGGLPSAPEMTCVGTPI